MQSQVRASTVLFIKILQIKYHMNQQVIYFSSNMIPNLTGQKYNGEYGETMYVFSKNETPHES